MAYLKFNKIHKINKRNQIGIIILIIATIIIILFLISPWNYFKKQNLNKHKELDSLSTYITSELKSALDEALIEAGKHGGYIYRLDLILPLVKNTNLYEYNRYYDIDNWTCMYIVQYNLFTDLPTYNTLTTFTPPSNQLSETLKRQIEARLNFFTQLLNAIGVKLPPSYPCNNIYLSNLSSYYCFDNPNDNDLLYLSLSTAPALNYRPYDLETIKTKAIEWHIEQYILYKLAKTLNLTYLTNYGYNITQDQNIGPTQLSLFDINNMRVKVTIGKNEVIAKLYLPIKTEKRYAKSRVLEYEAESKVRLGLIYELINKSLYEGELKDFDYNFVERFNALAKQYNITMTNIASFIDPYNDLRNPNSVDAYISGNDVFMIHDPNSIANNRAYDFIFARSNRIPAIKVIDAQTNQEVSYLNLRPDTTLILTSYPSHVTLPTPGPNQKVLNIICKDLDEDNLAIQIYGMGEDQDDSCFTKASNSNECYYYPWISSCQDRCDHDLMLWTLDGVNSTQRITSQSKSRIFISTAELSIKDLLEELESMGIAKNNFNLYIRCVELDEISNIARQGLSDYAHININITI